MNTKDFPGIVCLQIDIKTNEQIGIETKKNLM